MPNNYVLLERIELNASTASVTFSNIPQTGYTDLKLVMSSRGSNGLVYDTTKLVFNNTTSGYSTRYIQGNGATASSGTSGASTYIEILDQGGTSTANTFSNTEIYIPNYAGSNNKSVSIDAVTETNATTIYERLNAALWSNAAGINRITLSLDSATNYAVGSTFSLYGVAALGTTPAIAPKADGGNVIATDGTYWYHAFLSNGTFTPQVGLSCEALVIAGGGAGGVGHGAGAGAGGVIYTSSVSASSTPYTITVGAGGTSVSGLAGTNGVDSTALGLTAFGGGGGKGGNGGVGINGGSGGGGGAGASYATPAGGSSTQTSNGGGTGYGFAGGAGLSDLATYSFGGSGGGAGAAGTAATSTAAGIGGAGKNTWSTWATATNTGVSGYFAGGGGGGTGRSGYAGGAGGAGGGGGGGSTNSVAGTAGTINTGGGGGGGSSFSNNSTILGGNGGSGIVIVRYLVA